MYWYVLWERLLTQACSSNPYVTANYATENNTLQSYPIHTPTSAVLISDSVTQLYTFFLRMCKYELESVPQAYRNKTGWGRHFTRNRKCFSLVGCCFGRRKTEFLPSEPDFLSVPVRTTTNRRNQIVFPVRRYCLIAGLSPECSFLCCQYYQEWAPTGQTRCRLGWIKTYFYYSLLPNVSLIGRDQWNTY